MENSLDDLGGAHTPVAATGGRVGPPFRFKFWLGVTIAWLPFVIVPILALLTAMNRPGESGDFLV